MLNLYYDDYKRSHKYRENLSISHDYEPSNYSNGNAN